MKKCIYAVSIIMMIVFSLSACKKKDEGPAPQPAVKGPIIESSSAPAGHGVVGEKTEFSIVVPPDVKESWSAVTIIVNDKNIDKKQEITISIGDEARIPDSNITVKAGYFLPDFQMNGPIISSKSNTTNNPSAGVAIYDGDNMIFPESGEWGWLYSKFPTIHPFQHERFELTLKEGVKK